jgi:hypothetical protein
MNIFLLFSPTFESIHGSYFLMFFSLKVIWTAINKNAKNMFIVSNFMMLHYKKYSFSKNNKTWFVFYLENVIVTFYV